MITTATGTTVQRVTGGTAATTTPVVAPATVTFDPTTTTITTTDATSVAVGDVNGDGFADVVVGASGSGARTKVFLNLRSTSTTVGNVTTVTWNGIETTASTSLGTETATRAVLLADLTNDGSLDLVVVNAGVAHAVYVNLGLDAAGTTWQGLSAAVPVANTSAARGAAVADVDGDGFRDLVVAVDGAPALVYRNLRFTAPSTTWNGLGAGAPVAALPATPSARSVILSDVDGDGRADLLLGTTTETHLFLNRGGVTEAWKASAAARSSRPVRAMPSRSSTPTPTPTATCSPAARPSPCTSPSPPRSPGSGSPASPSFSSPRPERARPRATPR